MPIARYDHFPSRAEERAMALLFDRQDEGTITAAEQGASFSSYAAGKSAAKAARGAKGR